MGITGYCHFQVLIVSGSGTMLMQSTGQGATHSSQPVHSAATMVCICLAAPTMASTGQACRHRVQPMQVFSSMKATDLGLGAAVSSPNGLNSTPSRSASLWMPSSPPGGQRLMSAAPLAIASAYGLQPGKPHWPHCVCGSTASILSTSGLPSTLNLSAEKPSTAPSRMASADMTRMAISMIERWLLQKGTGALFDQTGEAHERQAHQAGGDHGDGRPLEDAGHIGAFQALTDACKQHQ